jgi:hypothetical protein
MEREKVETIMKEKIRQGWDFERIYNHLLIIDDLQKTYKIQNFSNE